MDRRDKEQLVLEGWEEKSEAKDLLMIHIILQHVRNIVRLPMEQFCKQTPDSFFRQRSILEKKVTKARFENEPDDPHI